MESPLFPFVAGLAGVFVAWIALNYLWNNKYRPKRLKNGVAVASFNNILGRTLRFLFKEDKVPSSKIKNPFVKKLLVWRNFYFACIAALIIMPIIGMDALPIGIALFVVAMTRTQKVFRDRHRILMRMFDVASVGLGYPRESTGNPWTWVNIKKWQDMTTPGDTVVRFPAKFKSGEQKNREAFENHFSSTVTEGNSWIFTWKHADSAVMLTPVTHIPDRAEYKGSAHAKWDEIPLGIGTNGEVVWEISKAPHALVTGSTGAGKTSNLKTPVLTANGWATIGDLKVGDVIFDANGNRTKVTHLHPIITPDKAYEITFRNGEKIVVDPDHLWETETRVARLSRFNNVKKEDGRQREFWLDENIVVKLQEELINTDSTATISIPEMAELTGKHPQTPSFYSIAKIIGPAEEVRPKIKFHYNAQVVKQKQTVTYVNSAEFMELYNSRRIIERKNTPISQNQYDKLRYLTNELRDSDSMDVESIIEYIDAGKFASEWVRENFDTTLSLKEAIADLTEKASAVKTVFPDKIFSIDKHEINALEFASLIDAEYNKGVRSTFLTVANKAASKVTRKEEVELIVPEKTIERFGNPYVTYPKQLFIERILDWNSTPLNDQRHNRETTSIKTTQELFDTLWTDENQTHKNHSIKKTPAIEFDERDLPVAPYSLGAWLGDGDSRRGAVCGIDHQVFEKIVSDGYPTGNISKQEDKHEDFQTVRFPLLHKTLKENGLLLQKGKFTRLDGSPKHIPAEYFIASIEQRRELLRGLLDTDGTVNKNGSAQFATSVPQLRDDVKRLVASLGYIPFVTQKEPTYTHKGENKTGQTAYTVSFFASPADRLFNLDRKNAAHEERFNANGGNSLIENHYIVDIKEVESVQMRCISVDSPSRLFAVSDSLIPTHNSVLQRNLIFHCIQHPDKWRFLGIDVKMVELTPYLKYEPVVMGVATNVEDGVEIIRYANEEMQNRYKMMTEKGVNNFRDLADPPHALMVMIDESYAFLAVTGNKTDDGKAKDALKGEASAAIGDIARLGRAAGVHLVMATQRPDATVIYGELKQNLSARIAAGRADTIASQMTLDNDQATRLPPTKGRGYFQQHGAGEQFQGYFAEQSWIDNWLTAKENGTEMVVEVPQESSGKPKKEKKLGGIFGKKNTTQSPEETPEEDEFVDLLEDDLDNPLEDLPVSDKTNSDLASLVNEFQDVDETEYDDPFDTEEPSFSVEDENPNTVKTSEKSLPVSPAPKASLPVASLPDEKPDLDALFGDLDDDYDSMFTPVSNSPVKKEEKTSTFENNFIPESDDNLFFDDLEPMAVNPKASAPPAPNSPKAPAAKAPVASSPPVSPAVRKAPVKPAMPSRPSAPKRPGT